MIWALCLIVEADYKTTIFAGYLLETEDRGPNKSKISNFLCT